MLTRSLTILLVFLSSLHLVLGANSTCYYPDGVANNGSPCNPDAEQTHCCGPTFVCLSNGLCKVGRDTTREYDFTYYRSGCTDSQWKDGACGQVCTGAKFNIDSGAGLLSCDNSKWCCALDRSDNCCQRSSDVFTLGAAEIMTTIPALRASESQSQTSTQSLTTSTSSASPQPTSVLPGSPQTETPYSIANSSSNSSSSNAVSIGVGVGIGVGGALALGLGALFFLRRRRNKKSDEKTAELDTQEERLHPQEKPADGPLTKYSHRDDQPAAHELDGEQGTGPHEMESHPTYELQGSDGSDQSVKPVYH